MKGGVNGHDFKSSSFNFGYSSDNPDFNKAFNLTRPPKGGCSFKLLATL